MGGGTLPVPHPVPKPAPPRPAHTAASGRLCSLVQGQESPHWLGKKAGVVHIPPAPHTPPQLPASALGSSLMEQEVVDLRKFPLCSTCTLGHCRTDPPGRLSRCQTGTSMPGGQTFQASTWGRSMPADSSVSALHPLPQAQSVSIVILHV